MSVLLNSLSLYLCHLLIFSRAETANAQKYQLIKGYNLWDNSLLWEDEEPHSLIQCLIICKQTERCCCVVLTSSTGKCSYYEWFKDESEYLAVEDGDADDIMILVKPIPVLLVLTDYSLLYEEGIARCAALGARVTSYDELNEAYNLGIHTCRCGFVNNGNGYYPTQVSVPECGSTIGIAFCDWSNRWDVYCTKD